MKIAFNTRFYQKTNTGIHNYTNNLYSELLKTDSKNEYLFFQTNTAKTIGETKILPLPDNKLADIFFDSFAVNKLIKEYKPDVFHSPCFVLPLQKLAKTKYITTIHDLVFLKYPHLAGIQTRLYYSMAVPGSAKNADLILTDSINSRNDIKNLLKIPEDKVRVLYPAINASYFDSEPTSRPSDQKYLYLNASSFRRKTFLAQYRLLPRPTMLRT